MTVECSICSHEADQVFKRVEVWSDERWRLTTSTYIAVRGLCYLEPKRHIEYITELDGAEAADFGRVMANVTNAIKSATGCSLVYVYIYGGHIPHLHVHLAPHTDGDVFFDDLVKPGAQVSDERMRSEDVDAFADALRGKLPS